MSCLKELPLPSICRGESSSNNTNITSAIVSGNVCGHGSILVGANKTNDRCAWKFEFQNPSDSFNMTPPVLASLDTSHDGKVIAAAAITSDGECIITLLSADNEGQMIATRRLGPVSEEPVDLVTVRFISRSKMEASYYSNEHSLVILTRSLSSSSSNTKTWLVSYSFRVDEEEDTRMFMMPQVRSMSIDLIHFSNSSNDTHNYTSDCNITALNGCFIFHGNVNEKKGNNQSIRFLVSDDDGSLYASDYDCQAKKSTSPLTLLQEGEQYCTTRPQASAAGGGDGMMMKVDSFLHDVSSGSGACVPLFVVPITKNRKAMDDNDNNNTKGVRQVNSIRWISVESLDVCGEYILDKRALAGSSSSSRGHHPHLAGNSKSSSSSPVLLAMDPVKSCDPESAVSIAVALKRSSASTSGIIQIVQFLVTGNDASIVDDEGGRRRNINLTCPHIVYSIPLEAASLSIPIRSIDISASREYAYNMKFTANQDSVTWKSLSVDSILHPVGLFRLLLEKGSYDEADELLANTDTFTHNNGYASMHGSEVALANLRSIVDSYGQQGLSRASSMVQAKDSLRRLAAGAVSGGEIGMHCLLEAATIISTWVLRDEIPAHLPSMQEFRMALLGMSSTLNGVSGAVMEENKSKLLAEKQRLDQKVSALSALEHALVDTGSSSEKANISKVPLTLSLIKNRSVEDLFLTLVSQGKLTMAERVRCSKYGASKISNDVIVESLLHVPDDLEPILFSPWLQEVVIPSIGFAEHTSLKRIRSWSCRIADKYDEEGKIGLSGAIVLLKSICEATAALSSKSFSPPVTSLGMDQYDNAGVSPKSSKKCNVFGSSPADADVSVLSIDSLSSCIKTRPKKVESFNPSLLQLEGLHAKPMRPTARLRASVDPNEQLDDESYDDCESKLMHAKMLQEARKIGLSKSSICLRNFASMGGADTIAVELFRSFFYDSQKSNVGSSKFLLDFCTKFSINCDKSIDRYTSQLTSGRGGSTPNALRQVDMLAKCCLESEMKCQIGLKALRSALLCPSQPPSSLFSLSDDMLAWSECNFDLQSQIQEATRLLKVNEILRRRCGNVATEYFRVAEPDHSVRLLRHICRLIDEKDVLADALDLCDAFTHLSKIEAGFLLCQRTMLATAAVDGNSADSEDERMRDRRGQCLEIVRQLYSTEERLGDEVTSRLIAFATEVISESANERFPSANDSHTRVARSVSSTACSIISFLIQENRFESSNSNAWFSLLGYCSLKELLQEMRRLSLLQKEFNVYMSLMDLRSHGRGMEELPGKIIQPVVDIVIDWCKVNVDVHQSSFERDQQLNTAVAKAKRGFRLLFGDDDKSAEWCNAVGRAVSTILTHDGENTCSLCVKFLEACGLLEPQVSAEAEREGSIALALAVKKMCTKATSYANEISRSCSDDLSPILLKAMRCIIQASVLLQEYALIDFPSGASLTEAAMLQSLTELVARVLVRSDGGIGEEIDSFLTSLRYEYRRRRRILSDDKYTDSGFNVKEDQLFSNASTSERFHSSWYIGDGLLLPPFEALSQCMKFCSEQLENFPSIQSSGAYADPFFPCDDDIYSFLSDRGAHSLAIRFYSFSLAMKSKREHFSPSVMKFWGDTTLSLAERSLGSSASGIVSGTVDSQQAVVHLLNISKKMAFRIYGSALPTAINRRDFDRLKSLAKLGVQLGEGKGNSFLPESVGWSNQSAFIEQCQELEKHAQWWKMLQFYGVKFEPRHFEGKSDGKNAARKSNVEYVSSLMPLLIRGACNKISDLKEVLSLARSFGRDFGCDLNLAPQRHVEFLLSWPAATRKDFCDIRSNLDLCETASRRALQLLPSSMARSAVLRRCVIALETSPDEACGRDYERHSLILQMYRSELSIVMEERQCKNVGNSQESALFDEEIESIERRSDALAVLMSAFNEKEMHKRPNYPTLFLPLPIPFGSNRGRAPPSRFSVIEQNDSKQFDPLVQFHPILAADSSGAITKALAPITYALGLPSGYIHARALQEQFKDAKNNKKRSLPPFEKDVLPILKRLRSVNDGVALGAWCAKRYNETSQDRLQCLKHTHSLALVASNESEQRKQQCPKSSDNYLAIARQEKQALDTLKVLGEHQSGLSDLCMVENVLLSEILSGGNRQMKPQILNLLSQLIPRITSKIVSGENDAFSRIPPEQFVEELLIESSHLASSAVLDGDISDMDSFRLIAIRVHAACTALDNEYSHVHVGNCARKLAKRWLMHGDDVIPTAKTASGDKDFGSTQMFADQSFSEEDTVSFVMDLNLLGKSRVYMEDIGSGDTENTKMEQVSTLEEPAGLNSHGSSREKSDLINTRSALRAAFVVSFAKGYFDHPPSYSSNENLQPNKSQHHRKKGNKLSLNLSSGKGTNADVVKEYARELLKIVFTKADAKIKSMIRHPLSPKKVKLGKEESVKTITFAMRNRALQAALVLCPRCEIDSIIHDEGYLRGSNCTLQKCAFGLFVATEVEAMGLPLPHSDLIHLSLMDRSSYARALWRDHGRTECKGFKGRLRLLLLELCTSEGNATDISLVTKLLHDISHLDLRRTALSGLEAIAVASHSCPSKIGTISTIIEHNKDALANSLNKSLKNVWDELEEISQESINVKETLSVLRRLCKIVTSLHEAAALPSQYLTSLNKRLCELGKHFESGEFSKGIVSLVYNLSRCVHGNERSTCLQEMMTLSDASSVLRDIMGGSTVIHVSGEEAASENVDTLNSLMLQVEGSFLRDIRNILTSVSPDE